MKKLFTPVAVAAAMASPALTQAQFSMPSIPGVGKLMGGSGSADVAGQGDALVRSYVGASKEVLSANAKMATALGLKDRKSTRLNSSHLVISYAVFCLKKKNIASPHVYDDINIVHPSHLSHYTTYDSIIDTHS